MCRNGSTTKVGYNDLQVDFASSAIGLCCQWQNAWLWETNCQIIAHCRILGSFLLIFECEIWFCWFQSMFVSGCSKSALYSCIWFVSITQNHSHTNILLTECSSGFLHFLLFVICLEPLWVVSFRAEKQVKKDSFS